MVGGVYVFLALCFALSTGLVGRFKGHNFWVWFLIGLVLPVLGLIGALVSRVETNELRRQCPRCGRVVKIYDAICMRCGCELDFPDVAIETENDAALRQS